MSYSDSCINWLTLISKIMASRSKPRSPIVYFSLANAIKNNGSFKGGLGGSEFVMSVKQ